MELLLTDSRLLKWWWCDQTNIYVGLKHRMSLQHNSTESSQTQLTGLKGLVVVHSEPRLQTTCNTELHKLSLCKALLKLSNREIDLHRVVWRPPSVSGLKKSNYPSESFSLSSTFNSFFFQQKVLGGDFFNKVCGHLKLLEKEYFGLEFRHHNGNYVRTSNTNKHTNTEHFVFIRLKARVLCCRCGWSCWSRSPNRLNVSHRNNIV